MKKFILIFTFLACLLAGFLFYFQESINSMEVILNTEKPFGFRFSLLDDTQNNTIQFLAQVVIFPKWNRIFLYCLNTDAYYKDKPIHKMNPRLADRLENYTKIKNMAYIHIKRTNGTRILNLTDGITFFSEEPFFFSQTSFLYSRGFQHYEGEQVLEYMILREGHASSSSGFPNELGRLFRQESMILNLFWQRRNLVSKMPAEMKAFAGDLIDTNLSKEELKSLFSYIFLDKVHMKVIEVPLRAQKFGKKKRLFVKETRATDLFQNARDEEFVGHSKPKHGYSLQILNGTDVQGLAHRIKFFFQNLDIRILDVDNYEPKPLRKTVLMGRSGDTFPARYLMEITGMKEKQISFFRQPLGIDLTLLLGLDFNAKKLQLR